MCRRALALIASVLALVLAACSDRGAGGQSDQALPGTTSASQATVPRSSLPAATSASCPTIPARQQPPGDRSRYVLEVDVDPATGLVVGEQQVAFTPDLDTDHLVFRLWPNGPRPAAGGARMEVTETVTVDGQEVASELSDPTTLVVRPGSTVAAGTTVQVEIPWRLAVPGPANDRISRDGDSMRLGSFFPILPWEPGVGWATEPAVGAFAEASSAPTADFDLTVTVPDGYQVLANGTPDPGRPGRFVATAVRDVGLSVGRFELAAAVAEAPEPVEVTVGVHQDGVVASADAYLRQVVAVLEDFGVRYGPYPWAQLTLAVTPGLAGGIEYPGHIMQGPGTLGEITSHEVGHMWFYGLVGNNQGRDPWLDEGLASWAEARYEQTLGRFLAAQVPDEGKGRLGEPMSFWAGLGLDYYPGVYVQGVQALGALGSPDLVDCALRVYVAQNAYDIATPADFVAAAEAVFPDAAGTLAGFGIRP